MIDPTKITRYGRDKKELAEFWLFCLCVAGKNSALTARMVNNLTSKVCPLLLLTMSDDERNDVLRDCKTGQYTRLNRALRETAEIDLKTATLEELLQIYGVGPKTARFFMLHSRRHCGCAVLDIHILRWLGNEANIAVPQNTPNNPLVYRKLEKKFLRLAKMHWPNKTVAEVDLMIWRAYSGH